MARWSYPQVEGVLYGLGNRAEARVASPRLDLAPVEHRPGPRGPFPETVRRLDATIALRRLDPADRAVIVQHYFKGAMVAKADRRRAVKHLVTVLGHESLDGGR